jgi:hypothetical protein
MKQGSDLRHPELMALFGVPDMVHDFDKPAGAHCPHQRHGKGCTVYAKRPLGCRTWTCAWLAGEEVLRRPDRTHYVVDTLPDFIRAEGVSVQVVQVWIDPDYPDAHRDPGLRAFVERQRMPALIRRNTHDAFLLVPPCLAKERQWLEIEISGAPLPQWGAWPEEIRPGH